jgi:hypothetical protein
LQKNSRVYVPTEWGQSETLGGFVPEIDPNVKLTFAQGHYALPKGHLLPQGQVPPLDGFEERQLHCRLQMAAWWRVRHHE